MLWTLFFIITYGLHEECPTQRVITKVFLRNKCKECDYSAFRNEHLKSHVNTAHLKLRFRCKECNNHYARKEHLSIHVSKQHNSKKTFHNFGSSSPSSYQPSLYEVKPFKCNHCDTGYSTKHVLYLTYDLHIKDKGSLTVIDVATHRLKET